VDRIERSSQDADPLPHRVVSVSPYDGPMPVRL